MTERSLYESGAMYGLLFADRQHDVPFYLETAAARGPSARVLDLGAGQGRLAIPLARAGHEVLAVDLAPAMLDGLAKQAAREPAAVRERLRWAEGCSRSFRRDETFDVVMCAFNGVAHHHRADDLAAFFEGARHHLAPEGRFVFDALAPEPERLADEDIDVPWFRHPETGHACRATERHRWDPAAQLMRIAIEVRDMTIEAPHEVHTLTLRLHSPDAWEGLLGEAGFVVERQHDLGDVQAFVARRA